MRLPVAATDPNPDGFTWTEEGELVMVAFTCERDKMDPDMGCGCGRAFAGLDSRKATTRAVVRELPLDLEGLRQVVMRCLTVSGWLAGTEPMPARDATLLAEVCAEMVEIGAMFDEGTQLVRYLDDIYPVAV